MTGVQTCALPICLSACGEVGESGGETEIIQADKETETVQPIFTFTMGSLERRISLGV